jgi:lipopolysaccharide transport system permease protein
MENREVTVVSADEKFNLGIKELLQYKDLFVTLTWRDFKVRYAQTALGLMWSLLQPVILMLAMTLLFARLMGGQGTMGYFTINPYVFTMSGTMLWGFFSFVLTTAGGSVIGAQGMIKKIYFPRLIIPLSKAALGLVDFGIAFLILAIMMIIFKVSISFQVLMCLFFVFTTMCAAVGIGIWVSALTIRYRDFQFITPFAVQLGLFLSPVGYPAELIIHNDTMPKFLHYLYFLNPMAGNIHGFRYFLFGVIEPERQAFGGSLTMLSVAMSFFLLFTSVLYFKKVEKEIADIV